MVIEALPELNPASAVSFVGPDAKDLKRRKAQLLRLAGSLPDDEAQRMIQLRREVFDQVDPDEWR